MATDYEITFEDEGCRVATYRSLVVSAWRSTPTVPRLAAVVRAAEKLRWMPPPAGAFSVVAAHPRLKLEVSDVVRRGAIGNLQYYKGADISSAFTIEGDGFAAAAMRSIVTGIFLAARPTYPIQVFPTRAQAAAWLVPRTQNPRVPGFDAAALLDVVEALFVGLA
jgi:hypothetical protein